MKIELTKEQIRLIVNWYYDSEAYHSERGVDMLPEEKELMIKLRVL